MELGYFIKYYHIILLQATDTDVIPSKWPDGPYALLTPNEGCPEADAFVWKRGYLSFTWQDPHTLMTAKGCEGMEVDNDDRYDMEMNTRDNDTDCTQNINTETWPYSGTNILGPFSRYALRLNFCCKEKDFAISGNMWPPGSYSIFGDVSGCPRGFHISFKNIKLPKIMSWKSHGCLPDYDVNDTDDSVMLKLKLCIRLTEEEEIHETNTAVFVPTQPFIFTKVDSNDCPELYEKNKVSESLFLGAEGNKTELFQICYYRDYSYLKDTDPLVYAGAYFPIITALAISNTRLYYENRTVSVIAKSSQSDLPLPWQWTDRYERTYVPLLVLDLGRNLMIDGLKISSHPLEKVLISEYTGPLSVTRNGLPCQRWDQMDPHIHDYNTPDLFPEKNVSNANNYCRSLDYMMCVWCFTQVHGVRWECCASEVYRVKRPPFVKCFISEEKWQVQDYGAITSPYTQYYHDGDLYYKLLRDVAGRYITLAGFESKDFSRVVKVLTKPELLYTLTTCNIDLGMKDGNIRDEQVHVSSWQASYPPESLRPFATGWCADMSDERPYVKVDMLVETKIEGISIWNWEETKESVENGTHTKEIVAKGSSELLVHYFSNASLGYENENQENKTFKLDMFLPVDQPQIFFHEPILARYIEIHIIQTVTANFKCLRFELHGCKEGGLPELGNDKFIDGDLELNIKQSYLSFLHQESVITSIGYPSHYSGGMVYTLIIDIKEQGYIRLLFTKISFNTYQEPATEYIVNTCDDNLQLKYLFTNKEGFVMDQTFNSLTSLIDTYATHMALSFTSCLPATRTLSQEAGFKANLNIQVEPSCFSFGKDLSREIINSCNLPAMHLASVSRLNIPFMHLQEKWIIHVKRFSIHLKIIYFNVRCNSGSSFTIIDRFSEGGSYCNLYMIPTDIYSNSDTLNIEFIKGQKTLNPTNVRYSATEGFEAVYYIKTESMPHLIDSKGTNFPVITKLHKLQLYGFRAESWQSATLLAYKGCSKTFGKCYSIFYGMDTTWNIAGDECWVRQQRLASIHFALEHQLLKYMLRNFRYVDMGVFTTETAFPEHVQSDPFSYAHIGLTRITKTTGEQLHVWEDGSPVTYSAWKTGEPSAGKDCTRMSFHLAYTNNTWEAESCQTGLANYFICEEPITDKLLNLSDSFFPHLYNGSLNYTVTGIQCQRWFASYPHKHGYDVRHYKFPHDGTSKGAQNFCRDPDGSGYIWCFTMDPNIRWQKCLQPLKVLDNIFPHDYTGRLSKSISNRTCQRWDSQEPHEQNAGKSASSFPDDSVEDAGNYCRDPTGEGTLWCYTTDPDIRWEPCSYIATAFDRCYETHSTYAGKWNKTRSGRECQNWNSQIPNSHQNFSDKQFPDGSVLKAVNYCRDPYNEGFLWCFTMDPTLKVEHCDFDYKYTVAENELYNENGHDVFVCKNGKTVPRRYLCNGKKNCQDFSDETQCTSKVHELVINKTINDLLPDAELSLFQCDNGEWISMLAHCDKLIDCQDASDETYCTTHKETIGYSTCPKGQFACQDKMCLHISQMCDFIVDCVDASDEDCDYPLCSDQQFRCNSEQCIPKKNRCDAFEQCIDGTDENSCDICNDDAFHCDLVRCIPSRVVCDKYPDCKDGSDELACVEPFHSTCEEWWEAGYRQSGIYKLLETEAECNFESVVKNGKIYTVFRNFEVTGVEYEVIHATFGELTLTNMSAIGMTDIMKDNNYICIQNITQTCIPARQAVLDLNNKSEATDCRCIRLTVSPYRYSEHPLYDYETVYASYCDGTGLLSESEQSHQMLFKYIEYDQLRLLELKAGFPVGAELQVGPAICVHKQQYEITSIGCGEENNVYPLSARCVYDTDAAGFIIGCRSGEHLQNCENVQCPYNTSKCPRSFCIPLRFVCDGDKQCPAGEDEMDCGCIDTDREVIVLYENQESLDIDHQIRTLANQFYTQHTIIRILKYETKTNSKLLHFDRILDISDEVIQPHETKKRQFVCNYTVLASSFINSIKFARSGSKGIIFIQNSEESEIVAHMMFSSIKISPEFQMYKVLRGIDDSPRKEESKFVTDVMIKRWGILETIGTQFFPLLCQEASNIYCPGEYKCAASKTCILLAQVCDGQKHCIHGDDERLCHYPCPEGCTCNEWTADCSYSNIDEITLQKLQKNSRLIDLSGNPALNDLLQDTELTFPFLISLNVSNCEIQSMESRVFQMLSNLRVLDLSFNKLSILPMYGFSGLEKLTMLNLLGNTNIYRIESYAFQGLLNIRKLEIIGANISQISSNAFAGLRLEILNLTDNSVHEMEGDMFGNLDVETIDFTRNKISYFHNDLFSGVTGLKSLLTPSFKYCCIRPNYLPEELCLPSKDEFSSCEDLLRFSALQTMLWLIGICALLGNGFSIMYRILYHRERLKLNYEIFVTNLAVADFLMGVYLIIIATADAIYRKRYIFVDDHWRKSVWCTVGGFLSTLSSEASVFFLCLITLDRFLAIKYPFGQIRLTTKQAVIASAVIWGASFVISFVPIIFDTYFQGKFYSKSGVCIALPLTRDRPPGWLYSIVVFIGLNFVTFCMIAVGQASIYMEVKRVASELKSVYRAKRRRTELTVAKNLLLVVSTDFMCWFPIGCIGLMAMSGYEISGDVYAWATVFILPVNSALNPVLYTLSVVLSNKKSKSMSLQKNQIPLDKKRRNKRSQITGLFQYFVMTDSTMQTFISLEDLGYTEQKLTAITVIRMSMQLAHCLHLLHNNSLTIDFLEQRVLYVSISNDEVFGDILLRKEPTSCKKLDNHKEDIYKFGNILRQLVQRVQKNKLQWG